MKIFDILPQGEEHALSGGEIDRLLGITPRERRAQASRELAQGLNGAVHFGAARRLF